MLGIQSRCSDAQELSSLMFVRPSFAVPAVNSKESEFLVDISFQLSRKWINHGKGLRITRCQSDGGQSILQKDIQRVKVALHQEHLPHWQQMTLLHQLCQVLLAYWTAVIA